MFNGFGNFGNFGKTLQNIFKPPSQTRQPITYGGLKPIQGYQYTPYQIKSGDTFDSIAQNNGFDVPAIQQANNGMIVPPPKGSYINLPANPQNSLGPVQGPPKPPGYGAPTGYGPLYQQRPLATSTTAAAPGFGTNTFQSGNGYNTAEASAYIQQQIASGQMPQTVSAYTPILNPETGEPVSDAEMVQNGYKYDSQKKEWKLAGAEGTTQQGQGGGGEFANTKFMQQYAAQGTGFYDQKRWDPDTKKFVRIGDLMRQGKLDAKGNWYGQRREKRNKPKPKATNAGGTPSQTTNTNQGGG